MATEAGEGRIAAQHWTVGQIRGWKLDFGRDNKDHNAKQRRVYEVVCKHVDLERLRDDLYRAQLALRCKTCHLEAGMPPAIR